MKCISDAPKIRTENATQARREDSRRRETAVQAVIGDSSHRFTSISQVANAAGVSRQFFYRRPQLYAEVVAYVARHTSTPLIGNGSAQVSVISLQAELANEKAARQRQSDHISRLENRLRTALGEQAADLHGLRTSDELETLRARNRHLEQETVDLNGKVNNLQDDLEAARDTNRALFRQQNAPGTP